MMESDDNYAAAEDMPSETAEKRPKKHPAKMFSTDDSCKLPKMVLNDELLCFIEKNIQGNPDSWGNMPTKYKKNTKIYQISF